MLDAISLTRWDRYSMQIPYRTVALCRMTSIQCDRRERRRVPRQCVSYAVHWSIW